MSINGYQRGVLTSGIVAAIVEDFTDRRGLRQAWDAIDDDIQEQILDRWRELVSAELGMVTSEDDQ